MRNSDCRALSFLETVSGCRAFSHSVFEVLRFRLVFRPQSQNLFRKCPSKTFQTSALSFSVVKIEPLGKEGVNVVNTNFVILLFQNTTDLSH